MNFFQSQFTRNRTLFLIRMICALFFISSFSLVRAQQGSVNTQQATSSELCHSLEECETLSFRIYSQIINIELSTPSLTVGQVPHRFQFDRNHDNPALNRAFRDPSGRIWGEAFKGYNNRVITMDHEHALQYCQSIGARLPSKEDYLALRRYLGATTDQDVTTDYTPSILKDLTIMDSGGERGLSYWTSSFNVTPTQCRCSEAYYFLGSNGALHPAARYRNSDHGVRCIIPSRDVTISQTNATTCSCSH